MGVISNVVGGSGSSSTSSSSGTSSWLSDLIEPIVTDFVNGNPSIDYENSIVAGMTPAEQAALDRYASGSSITTGTNIAQGGAGLVQEQVARMESLLSGGAASQFKTGVTGLYNGASGFIDQQDSAIQDQVYAEMGNQFGQSAQSNMASTSVAGSSNAQNATNSILASGANEMTQMMADVSSGVLKGAVGITGNALQGEMGLINSLMKEGGNIFQTGANIAGKGSSNQFKAGLFEQYYNQEVNNNNRKNDMINNNMDWLNMAALLDVVLPTAGIDTTTTSSSSTDSGSGIMGGLF